ncbi:hypothetical protein [Shouchella patagoniensis]|uniref:hypothetical protein n=1 Tax=Shouchella patagoniensis TaxID=228576 RepID=UPI000995CE1E|nr:hypothetical protein [Shouchella patagoniensis]
MPVYVRYIDLNGCKNSYCLPEQPNGFAVFVISDSSILTKFEVKKLINYLVYSGYTVFSTSLLDAHWGSAKAVNHARDLIQLFLKKETVNKRIFLYAEGSGALIAKQLLIDNDISIRAAAVMKPFFTLESVLKEKQADDLARKRFQKEVKEAYGLTADATIKQIKRLDQAYQHRLKNKLPPMRVYGYLDEGRANISCLAPTQYVDYFFLAKRTDVIELPKQIDRFYEQFHSDNQMGNDL